MLVLPVGMANTEVNATTPLDLTVPPLQSVRWKITEGPDPANTAYVCAVAMQVSPVGTG